MTNRKARSPGALSRLDIHGQVSTKPGHSVDANAGIWYSLASDLRSMGRSLGAMADRAMKRREQRDIKAGKDQGYNDGFNVDLGTSYRPDAPMRDRPVSNNSSDVDAYLDALMVSESGGNPNAKNPGKGQTATGHFQFIDSTWKGLMQRYPELGLTANGRTDPEQSRKAALAFTQDNIKSLTDAGVPITRGNLYIAHMVPALAAKVIKAPDSAKMTDLFSPEIIKANAGMEHKASRTKLANMTVSQFKQEMARRVGGNSVMSAVKQQDMSQFSWDKYRTGGATRPDSFSGMKPQMQQNLAAFMQAADRELGEGLKVYSGFRSNELQGQLFRNAVKKYGSESAARKWVAPPGNSKHNTGEAADLKFNGVRIDKADPKIGKWIRDNAPKHGLNVRMAWEPWQVELSTDGKTTSVSTSNAAGSGRPSPNGPALALRGDQGVMGEAYRETQNRVVMRRLPMEIDQQMDDIFETFKDDPAALNNAFNDAEETVLNRVRAISDDPAVELLARETFYKKRKVFEKSAQADEDRRMRDGEKADYNEVVNAARNSLQKRAYLIGDDPEAAEDLNVSVNESLGAIEDALDAGLINAQTALKHRQEILETVTSARMEGVFDSLPSAEEKAAFVEDLRKRWGEGDALLSSMSLEEIQTMERKFSAKIAGERRQLTAKTKLEKKKMERILSDDLASIRQTGVGLSIDGQELKRDQVEAVLGESVADDWQHKRGLQHDMFKAVSGLDVMPVDDMMTHLEQLAPKPGEPGYVDQMEVLKVAKQEAKRIAELRKRDPAAAVEQAFDDLEQLKEAAYEGDLSALEALIKGRLDAQASIEIPEYGRQPLTNAELESLARPLIGELDRTDWIQMARKVDQTYGPFADEVMAQLVEWKGLGKDASSAAVQYLKSLKMGEQPSRIDSKGQATSLDAGAANDAMAGGFDAVAWKAMPNQGQIQHLLANPDLANDFDEKFGAGAAKLYLSAQERSRQQTELYQQNLERQGITINPDGSEDYDPAKEVKK